MSRLFLCVAMILVAIAAYFVIQEFNSDDDPGLQETISDADRKNPRRKARRGEAKAVVAPSSIEGSLVNEQGQTLAGTLHLKLTYPPGTGRDGEVIAVRQTAIPESGVIRHSLEDYAIVSIQISSAGYARARLKPLLFVGQALRLGEIRLTRGRGLIGRVVGDKNVGIDGVSLQFAPPARNRAQGDDGAIFHTGLHRDAIVTALSDAEGRFEIRGLPDESLRGTATKAGFQAWSAEDIETGRAESPAEIEITLERGLAIAGLIVDQRNRPIESALVSLTARGYRPEDRVLIEQLKLSTKTNSEGHFEFRDLPDRSYRMRIQKTGFIDLKPKNVRPPERKLKIVMNEGARVGGVVRLKASGRAIVPEQITARGLGRRGQTSALSLLQGEEAGRILGETPLEAHYLVSGLRGAKISIEVEATGGASGLFETHRLKPGELRRLNLELPAESRLLGSVRDANGKTVDGAAIEVTLVASDDDDGMDAERALATGNLSAVDPAQTGTALWQPLGIHHCVSDASGAFTAKGLAPRATYRLRAQHPELGKSTEVTYQTRPGDLSGLDIRFPPVGRIEGRIVMNGQNQAAALVLLRRPPPADAVGVEAKELFSEVLLETRADHTGRFAFYGISPGSYVLQGAAALDHQRDLQAPGAFHEILVQSGALTEFDIVLGP